MSAAARVLTKPSPAIRVIIPTYLASCYKAASLDCVLTHTFTDYEILPVNHTSVETAKLASVLEPCHRRVVAVVKGAGGLPASRTARIRASRDDAPRKLLHMQAAPGRAASFHAPILMRSASAYSASLSLTKVFMSRYRHLAH